MDALECHWQHFLYVIILESLQLSSDSQKGFATKKRLMIIFYSGKYPSYPSSEVHVSEFLSSDEEVFEWKIRDKP